jgi:hypothetical protein
MLHVMLLERSLQSILITFDEEPFGHLTIPQSDISLYNQCMGEI